MPVCGVNQNLFQPYHFNSHHWKTMSGRVDLLELAERCVKMNTGEYWMKIPNTGQWNVVTKLSDAKNDAKNLWVNTVLRNGVVVTNELIDTFFDGEEVSYTVVNGRSIKTKKWVGCCPMIHGRMVIPYGPQFLTYKGLHYINTWQNDGLVGDEAHLKDGLAVLEMVYRSICAGDQLDTNKNSEAELLLGQIINNNYGDDIEFRFLINWLAALVQNPGVNLQTNVWLFGDQQGIGKGTLVDIMRIILGNNMVGKLKQDEIERGWDGDIAGKILIEVDEFETNKKYGWSGSTWNRWIKSFTCEYEVKFTRRAKDPVDTINIGNYIFAGNTLAGIYFDANDRRNMIINTTDDISWRSYASHIRKNFLMTDKRHNIAAGFAWILEQVKVDWNLIKSAPETQAKANIQSVSASPIEQWLTDGCSDKGAWRTSTYLYDSYKTWFSHSMPGYIPETFRKFGLEMTKMSKRGIIARKITAKGTEYNVPLVAASAANTANHDEQAAKDISEIIGEEIPTYDYDEEITPPDQAAAKSPMEKCRDELRKQDKVVHMWDKNWRLVDRSL